MCVSAVSRITFVPFAPKTAFAVGDLLVGKLSIPLLSRRKPTLAAYSIEEGRRVWSLEFSSDFSVCFARGSCITRQLSGSSLHEVDIKSGQLVQTTELPHTPNGNLWITPNGDVVYPSMCALKSQLNFGRIEDGEFTTSHVVPLGSEKVYSDGINVMLMKQDRCYRFHEPRVTRVITPDLESTETVVNVAGDILQRGSQMWVVTSPIFSKNWSQIAYFSNWQNRDPDVVKEIMGEGFKLQGPFEDGTVCLIRRVGGNFFYNPSWDYPVVEWGKSSTIDDVFVPRWPTTPMVYTLNRADYLLDVHTPDDVKTVALDNALPSVSIAHVTSGGHAFITC